MSGLYGTQESNISLINIFPALVYHGQSSVCKARQDETIHGTSHAKLSSAEGSILAKTCTFQQCGI